MQVWEDYYNGKRRKGFRFREEDVRITVQGSEFDETEVGIYEEYETFIKEYSYKDITKAFRDFLELVEKDWSHVELRIESKTEQELIIVFDRFYFITDFITTIDNLCKDSEMLKAVYEKIEEIRKILQEG